jgi:hypothetical protein
MSCGEKNDAHNKHHIHAKNTNSDTKRKDERNREERRSSRTVSHKNVLHETVQQDYEKRMQRPVDDAPAKNIHTHNKNAINNSQVHHKSSNK